MDINRYRELHEQYDAYRADCEIGLENLMTQIKGMRIFWKKNKQEDMFYNVKKRLKSFDSALEKCTRKGIEPSAKNFRRLRDIAGVRITVLSEKDAYKTQKILEEQMTISVDEIDDYIAHPKDNGYRSIHVTILVTTQLPNGKVMKTPVEVQIRTIAMDAHAEPEHAFNYKSEYPEEIKQEISQKFYRIGEMTREIDRILAEICELAPDAM